MDANGAAFEDFRMLYQMLINDIENTKRRQWAVTYYLLLLLGAIIGFSGLIDIEKGWSCSWEKCLLILISTAISVFGTCYLNYLTGTLIRYRKRANETLSYLSEDFRNFEKKWLRIRYKSEDRAKKDTSWGSVFLEFSAYLVIMLWIVWFFVFWFLFLTN
jgi:hypothetical protein